MTKLPGSGATDDGRRLFVAMVTHEHVYTGSHVTGAVQDGKGAVSEETEGDG